jgi:hypothetical protein
MLLLEVLCITRPGRIEEGRREFRSEAHEEVRAQMQPSLDALA